MQFKDVLMSYHVSPLMYDDGVLLDERDYNDLFMLLLKYYTAKYYTDGSKIPSIPDGLIDKVKRNIKNSLIPFTDKELLDILTEQNRKEII